VWRRSSLGDGAGRIRRALVIDDSIGLGRRMRRVRRRLASVRNLPPLIFAAVYATPVSVARVDLAFEVVSFPRMFEWNFMHHGVLRDACLDIDGVLCRDPTPEENDDGPRYRRFLRTVEPCVLPTLPIGLFVTCRLEKYRQDTERWLAQHGVEYEKLVMLDLPDKASRQRQPIHAVHQAAVYRNCDKYSFIGSSPEQARTIAKLSGKTVLCFETREVFYG
jgi:orotate phosphoribosyltransferase